MSSAFSGFRKLHRVMQRSRSGGRRWNALAHRLHRLTPVSIQRCARFFLSTPVVKCRCYCQQQQPPMCIEKWWNLCNLRGTQFQPISAGNSSRTITSGHQLLLHVTLLLLARKRPLLAGTELIRRIFTRKSEAQSIFNIIYSAAGLVVRLITRPSVKWRCASWYLIELLTEKLVSLSTTRRKLPISKKKKKINK